jgi:hypothetical protein
VKETIVCVGRGDVRRVYGFTYDYFLASDTLDAWSWVPDLTVGYSVSGACRLLSNRIPPHDFVPSDLL